MKLADYVALRLAEAGIQHAFGVSGGASLHLIHGIADREDIHFIPTTHECNAGFAADAYARIRGLGCAIATSGPGAGNLITAISASFYDSVPVVYITGNCTVPRMGRNFEAPVRQYGFQEMPIHLMARPITKYSVCIKNPSDIGKELDKALYIAQEGRKGPVLIDIPDDVQRADVGLPVLRYTPPPKSIHEESVELIVKQLGMAKRPLFIWGAGIQGANREALALAERLNVPIVTTWGAAHLIKRTHPLMAGAFGTHGNRAANLAVANADFIISLGSRLDTKAIPDPKTWAREAKLCMVDVDAAERSKFRDLGRPVDYSIGMPARAFVRKVANHAKVLPMTTPEIWVQWLQRIGSWRIGFDRENDGQQFVPAEMVDRWAKWAHGCAVLVSDTGLTLGWLMQHYPFDGETPFLHAFNATPMGYALPAALGAAFATGGKVAAFCGDGSILMSLSELATIKQYNLPIQIVLVDNKGHGMCRQTQRQWLGGKYPSTSLSGGLGLPANWGSIFGAFGIRPSNFIIESVPEDAHLVPQARFGQPLEDPDPLLPFEELKKQMIIPPLERK